MLCKSPLPPSSRDFEVYRLVQVDEMSHRQAAQVVHLSPTRVRQILQKVGDNLGAKVLGSDDQPVEQQLRVAQLIACERVNHLYGQSLRSWGDSKKHKETLRRITKDGQPTTTIETIQSTSGNCQYLNAALRYALAAGKLPMKRMAELETVAEDEDEALFEQAELEEGYEAVSEQVEVAELEPIAPPVGDCAAQPLEAVEIAAQSVSDDDASDAVAISCDDVAATEAAARQTSISPAQSPPLRQSDVVPPAPQAPARSEFIFRKGKRVPRVARKLQPTAA